MMNTQTRRTVSGGNAKRKNTTPAPRPGAQICKQALPRMEYVIDTLATYVVADGWHESWESGPMPKRAADVMAYLRAQAAGKRENAAKEAEVNAFIKDCGQSWDWIFGGDVRGMICKAAAGTAAPEPRLGRAFSEIESSLRDLPRIARLADEQLHRAIGELHLVDNKYTEMPDYATAELAIFAVSQVAQMAWRAFTTAFTAQPRKRTRHKRSSQLTARRFTPGGLLFSALSRSARSAQATGQDRHRLWVRDNPGSFARCAVGRWSNWLSDHHRPRDD
jgi:hypothetical protein